MRDGVSGVVEGLPSDFEIVKWNDTVTSLLILLMALAGNQHDIASLGFMNRQLNGFATIWFKGVTDTRTLKAGKRIVHDGNRILTTWIVARQDDEVAALPSGLTHQGTLGAVAVTATTEHGNYPARSA